MADLEQPLLGEAAQPPEAPAESRPRGFWARARPAVSEPEAAPPAAGGADAAIIPSGIGGFIACKALSKRNDAPAAASRPWDADRDGFVMGEGAGVLVLESLAQIGGILAYASDPFDPVSNLMFFLGIDKAKFRHPVVPGDRVDLHVAVVHHRSNVWKFRGEASVDGTLAAEAELLASIVDREP